MDTKGFHVDRYFYFLYNDEWGNIKLVPKSWKL
jgi:hypothetical protein